MSTEDIGKLAVSSMTLHWPYDLMADPGWHHDYARLDFAINLMCLAALVEALVASPDIVSCSQAFDLAPLEYPVAFRVSGVDGQSSPERLFHLYTEAEVVQLNQQIY